MRLSTTYTRRSKYKIRVRLYFLKIIARVSDQTRNTRTPCQTAYVARGKFAEKCVYLHCLATCGLFTDNLSVWTRLKYNRLVRLIFIFRRSTLLHSLTTEQRFIKVKYLQSLPPSGQEERISFVSQIYCR